jgi:outer membrane protein assembly factor BamD
MRNTVFLTWFLLAGLSSACGGRNVAGDKPAVKPPLNEPDKALYERAKREMKRGRYDIARLTLQTLINTYPDSEYLPKAKFGLGEASFREGGKDRLNQAAVEFEEYITFFPTTEDADDAQMWIALTHYKQMLAPDRDATQARYALFELDKMIKEYPGSPLLEEAKARRRVVQERLAEGAHKIGNLYFVRREYRAAIGRYEEITKTYPDYTKLDQVLYSLAEALREAKAISKSPESESGIPVDYCFCILHYQRIVREFPHSERVGDSVRRLKELQMAVPEPNPEALARVNSKVEERGLFDKVIGMVLDRGPVDANKTGATSVTREGNKQSGNEVKGTLSVLP